MLLAERLQRTIFGDEWRTVRELDAKEVEMTELLKQPLTVGEVAEFLRLSETSVRAMIRDGSIPGVRVGNQFRIPAEWLDRFSLPKAA